MILYSEQIFQLCKRHPADRKVKGIKLRASIENRPLTGVGLVVLAMASIGLIDNYIRLIAKDTGNGSFISCARW